MDWDEYFNGTGDLEEEEDDDNDEETQDQASPQEDDVQQRLKRAWQVTVHVLFDTLLWIYRLIPQPEEPQPDWATDNTLVRVQIPTPIPEFWPESGTLRHGRGRSYEVTTDSVIYKITTSPTDFIGTTRKEWPKELEEGYNRYKAPEVAMDEVFGDYLNEMNSQAPDESILYRLQCEKYELAKDAAEARVAFLRRWPNAFERHGSTDSHWHYPNVLIEKANDAQRLAAHHYSRILPRPAEEKPPLPPVLTQDVIGLKLYGIGPRWYRTLRKREMARKKLDREEVLDPEVWDATLETRPSLSRPSLPRLRRELAPGLLSDVFLVVGDFVKLVLIVFGLLDADFADARWLKYV